jgi:hypothetical protein
VCTIHFRSKAIDAHQSLPPTDAAQHDRKKYSPYLQASKHCHLRLGKFKRKAKVFHDSSPIVSAIDFRSTAIDATQTPHPMMLINPTGNSIPLKPQASKHFSLTATLNTQKATFFHNRSPTVCPVDIQSTAVDASQEPAPSDVRQPDRK